MSATGTAGCTSCNMRARGSLVARSSVYGRLSIAMRIAMTLAGAILSVASGDAQAQQAPVFHLQEATIAGIRAAFASGRLTCTQLTKLYLDRINAYNLRGPSLHAII